MTTSITTDLPNDVRLLLSASITDVFATMFDMEAKSAAVQNLRANGELVVAGSVGFVGAANGMVYIFFGAGFAQELADRFLGSDEPGSSSEEMVNDVVGELSNMVVGGVKSQLCDLGFSCVLTIPSVMRGRNLSAVPIHRVDQQIMGFRCGAGYILVELQLKPVQETSKI